MANCITDYVSGQEIPSGPEEVQATQVFSKILCEDYGYPTDYMQTRPQYHVKSFPSDKRGYPVDIAVFDKVKGKKKLKMVVECKSPEKREGIEQLESYLKFCDAEIGIWFNGKESAYIRKIQNENSIEFEEIIAFPKFGEDYSSIGRYKRKDLKPTHNLKEIFKEIRGYIVGNSVGVNRDEQIAREMTHLILCKIFDERFTKPNDTVKFHASLSEEPEEVAGRIQALFRAVKGKYSDVLSESDEISLDSTTLCHVIGKLQNFCFIEMERDIIADAFEVFIGESLKGEQGQFFTPKNVGQLLVAAANPDRKEITIDTACGSGLFLVETLKHLWEKVEALGVELDWNDATIAEEKMEVGIRCIRGLEKDSFLTKLSKSYMAILGDGKGGIFCEDSLNLPEKWSADTQQKIGKGQANVCITNPPFGKDIQVTGKAKLEQYELGKTSNGKVLQKGNPSILFLERDLQLLAENGRLAIILPETYFHAPTKKNVRSFIKKHNIQYIFDLSHDTFRPHCNAKCIAIVLEKDAPQQENIVMGVVKNIGHDHLGKPEYRRNKETDQVEINDDIPEIIEAIKSIQQGKPIESELVFSVPAETVLSKDILIPRYYWHEKMKDIEQEAEELGFDLVELSELVKDGTLEYFDGHGSPSAAQKGKGDIPYVRVKDIVQWQIYKDPTALVSESVYEYFYREQKELKEKDVLFVRRGSYRIGSVAIVSPYDIKSILTTEILVMRVSKNNSWNITPEYLLYALSHKLTVQQIENKVFIDTTLPNIAGRWQELKIPIYKDQKKQEEMSKRIEDTIVLQWKVLEEIANLKINYGIYNT